MALTPPPAAPSTNDPANFDKRADAHVAWQATNVAEMSALQLDVAAKQAAVSLAAPAAIAAADTATAAALSAVNAPGTSATSTTSVPIARGPTAITIQAGKAFAVGQNVVIAATTAPTNCMTGRITAHNPATGALTVNVTYIDGTGTFAAWTVSLSARDASVQVVLVSGVNLRPINGASLLGAENLVIGAQTGDTLTTATPLSTPDWLPCNGATYLKSSYPALAAKLGSLLGATPVSAWAARTLPSSQPWASLAYGKGVIVAVPSGGVSTNIIATSSDNGATWTQRTLPTASYLGMVTFQGDRFFIPTGTAGTYYMFSSSDGLTWVSLTTPSMAQQLGPVYGNGFYLIEAYGKIQKSTDGITWAGSATITDAQSSIPRFCNGIFLVADGATTYHTSTDGVTWTPHTTSLGISSLSMGVYNGMFVSGDKKYRSSDGINWKAVGDIPSEVPDPRTWLDCGNGRLVAVSQTAVWVSEDSLTWVNTSSLPLPTQGVPVFVNGSIFATSGAGYSSPVSTLYVSPLMSYDTATQFAAPSAQSPVGTKTYIKA